MPLPHPRLGQKVAHSLHPKSPTTYTSHPSSERKHLFLLASSALWPPAIRQHFHCFVGESSYIPIPGTLILPPMMKCLTTLAKLYNGCICKHKPTQTLPATLCARSPAAREAWMLFKRQPGLGTFRCKDRQNRSNSMTQILHADDTLVPLFDQASMLKFC